MKTSKKIQIGVYITALFASPFIANWVDLSNGGTFIWVLGFVLLGIFIVAEELIK